MLKHISNFLSGKPEETTKEKIFNYCIRLINDTNQHCSVLIMRLKNDQNQQINSDFEEEIEELSTLWENLYSTIKIILNKYSSEDKLKLVIIDEIKKNPITISKIPILIIKDLEKKKKILEDILIKLESIKNTKN